MPPFHCFLLLRQNTVPTKTKASAELYHRNYPFFTRLHETTTFRKWKAKRTIGQPFSSHYHFSIFLYTITQNPKLSRKLIYKHENSEQFPCLYHIPHFSTAFSVKLIRLSAKTANILHLFTFPLYTITETPDFCVIVYFCLIVRFFPYRPTISGIKKHKNRGSPPTVMTPTKPKNPLILSHSSILLPTGTQIPMALFLNSRMCRC